MLHNIVSTAWNASSGDVIGVVGVAVLLFVVWKIIVAMTVRDVNRDADRQ